MRPQVDAVGGQRRLGPRRGRAQRLSGRGSSGRRRGLADVDFDEDEDEAAAAAILAPLLTPMLVLLGGVSRVAWAEILRSERSRVLSNTLVEEPVEMLLTSSARSLVSVLPRVIRLMVESRVSVP